MLVPPNRTGPLVGLKVLEIGHYIAAPFCTRILADLGAEVIKLEPPGGDPFRGWGAAVNGHTGCCLLSMNGPRGYKRSDERLREEISERLTQAGDIDCSKVTVEVLGGRVVLEGTVPDRYMKHAIEELADAAPGVEDVENRIGVAGA